MSDFGDNAAIGIGIGCMLSAFIMSAVTLFVIIKLMYLVLFVW